MLDSRKAGVEGEPMISKVQIQRLRVLVRDVGGCQLSIRATEIALEDDHGGYTFENDESGYLGAVAVLQSLKPCLKTGVP